MISITSSLGRGRCLHADQHRRIRLAKNRNALRTEYRRHNLQAKHQRRCVHRCSPTDVRATVATESDHSAEFSSDYSEFIANLEAPFGFALAPDTNEQVLSFLLWSTNCSFCVEILVVKVEPGSSAQQQNVMVGDLFKQCTSGLNPEMVHAYTDLRKIQWAINKNQQRLRLVLKRQQALGRIKWYRSGASGCISGHSGWLITPLHFPSNSVVEWSNKREGHSLVVAFHKTIIDEDFSRSKNSIANAFRRKKAAEMKSSLLDALQLPTLVLPRYSMVQPTSVADDEKDDESCPLDFLDEEDLTSTFEQSTVEERLNSKKLIPILPWLQVTTGRLAQPDILELASQCALQSLLELRLHKCDDSVALAGIPCQSTDRVLGIVIATATLHRLVVRRKAMRNEGIRACNILLHCEEDMSSAVATLLSAYYYWYGMLDIDEAIILAEMAISARVSKGLLHEASDFLYRQAKHKKSSVTVIWPYPANSAMVAGELVGGWDKRAILHRPHPSFSPCFDIPRSAHYLRIKGLRPGIYHYKFIINDQHWVMDTNAPTDVDRSGNWNNVLSVKFKKSNTTDQRRYRPELCRLFAALIALRIKRSSFAVT